MFDSKLLADQNRCIYTSLETRLKCDYVNLKVYKDDHNRIRIVAYDNKVSDKGASPVGAMLLNKLSKNNYQIAGVFVYSNFRRLGIAKSLLAVARQMFKSIRHSDNLTEEGEKWLKGVEGLE